MHTLSLHDALPIYIFSQLNVYCWLRIIGLAGAMITECSFGQVESSIKKKEQCFLVPALFWASKNLKARINKLNCFKAYESTLH